LTDDASAFAFNPRAFTLIFECAGDAFLMRETAPGADKDELLEKTEAVLRFV